MFPTVFFRRIHGLLDLVHVASKQFVCKKFCSLLFAPHTSFLNLSRLVLTHCRLRVPAGRGEPEDSTGPEDSFGGSAVGSEERGGEEERAPAAVHQRQMFLGAGEGRAQMQDCTGNSVNGELVRRTFKRAVMHCVFACSSVRTCQPSALV